MTIGCAAIVKNDAYIIEDALLACRHLFDQFFVLDTGSTDGTQDILKRLNVDWQQGEWHDDFSRARNQAWQNLRTDWVLVLDADEIVSAETVAAIRQALQNPDATAYWLNLCNSPRGSYQTQVHHQVGRLFKRDSGIHYVRPINENLADAEDKFLPVKVLPAIIHHWGNIAHLAEQPEKKKEKLARNIRLMSAWLKDHPQDTEAWIFLAQTHLLDQNYAEAFACFDRAMAKPRNTNQQQFILEHMCVCLDKMQDYKKLLMACQALQAAEPDNAIAMYHLILMAVSEGHVKAALNAFPLLLTLPVRERHPYNTLYTYYTKLRYVAYGKLLEQQGRRAEAAQVYQQGVKDFGDAFLNDLLTQVATPQV